MKSSCPEQTALSSLFLCLDKSFLCLGSGYARFIPAALRESWLSGKASPSRIPQPGSPWRALSRAPPPVTYRCEKRWPERGRGRARRRGAAAPSPFSLRRIHGQTGENEGVRAKQSKEGNLNDPERSNSA